jgi:hypothetical protein
VLVFAAAFVSLSLASETGAWLRRRYSGAGDERNEALSVILGATLTLLALIIGFSFSMATNRYDQRKNFEEAEANAIGTEILRADLLPPADASSVRKLLGDYLDQQITLKRASVLTQRKCSRGSLTCASTDFPPSRSSRQLRSVAMREARAQSAGADAEIAALKQQTASNGTETRRVAEADSSQYSSGRES